MDTLKAFLDIFREMIETMQVNGDAMAKAARYGYINEIGRAHV